MRRKKSKTPGKAAVVLRAKLLPWMLVLPGAYLSGADPVTSPGRPYIRVALVDETATVDSALARLSAVLDA